MRIKVHKFKSGERYIFLLDDDGVPDFWVTHYVTQRLRMNKAATTIEQYLKEIKHFRRWEMLNGRDVLQEIYNGRVLSLKDIKNLKEHCAYQAKALDQSQVGKVVDMGKFYLSKIKERPTVSTKHYKTRVRRIADFLHFIGQEMVKMGPSAVKLFDELDEMKRRLTSDLPKARLNRTSVDKSGIPDSSFEDFVSVSKPDSEHNPFKMSVVQLRNYLIVQTLYETGFRYSELLALRIGDIETDIDDPRLLVERRHDSNDDPRTREPTAKTLGRSVSISKGLRDLLQTYIRHHRSQTKLAKTHPFIFVSHKGKKGYYHSGQPLAKGSVNSLYKRIQNVNSEMFWGITPQSYRHFSNDQLSKCFDEYKAEVKNEVARLERAGQIQEAKQYANENQLTEARELEIRAELNGHSSLSSGRTYLKRTTRKLATEMRKKMEDNLMHKIKEANNGS